MNAGARDQGGFKASIGACAMGARGDDDDDDDEADAGMSTLENLHANGGPALSSTTAFAVDRRSHRADNFWGVQSDAHKLGASPAADRRDQLIKYDYVRSTRTESM